MPASQQLSTTCCIAGGGPAGMMLGYLLARAGIEVVVLEKHADFFRDFRGDTIHPSTLELMYELGILDEFLACKHNELTSIAGDIGGESVTIADFSHLPTNCNFLAIMPQWDFLNFIVEHARRYPTFHFMMQANVTDVIEEDGVITGVRTTTPDGGVDIYAVLTVAADGRGSTLRQAARLTIDDLGAPMDVLWFRLTKHPDEAAPALGHLRNGKIMVTINRETYWQCGFVITKGAFDNLRARGIEALRADIAATAPELRDRMSEIASWDDVNLLSVRVDRLRTWYRPGLLCIGDAAHAMSPVGGVGINLAIQDAVAAANALAAPLLRGSVDVDVLARIQKRRTFPTRMTQAMQVFIQRHVIRPVLGSTSTPKLPLLLRLLQRWPYLQRIPARLLGVGFRPEHIRTSSMD